MRGRKHLRAAALGVLFLLAGDAAAASAPPRRPDAPRQVVLQIRPAGARKTFCAHVSEASFLRRRNVFRMR
jgi:hypothetical protein